MRSPFVVATVTARAVALAGAIGAIGAGCRGRSTDPAPAPASGGPASTADADALWALAPAGARGGIVATPRAVAMAEQAVAELRGVLASAPELAPWRQALDELLDEELGIPRATLAELGLTGTKGFALFLVRGGMVAILPVADRARLLARAAGAATGDGPRVAEPRSSNDDRGSPKGFDRIGSVACTETRGVYACATAQALLATLGGGDLAAQLAAVGARGDLELVGIELPLGGEAPGRVAAVVQLERGAAVIRGTLAGAAPAILERLTGAHRPRVDPARTAAFAIADLSMLAGDAIAARGGAALAEVVRSLRGPLAVAVPAGQLVPEAEQALTDPAPMRAVVEGCPILARPFGLTAVVAGGTCRVELPIAGASIEAWVEGTTLRFGTRGAALTGAPVAMTPIGAELARGPWAFAFWGRGSLLALPPPAPAASTDPPALPPEAALRIRALALLDELGAGIRRDGDALHVVVALRTAFANPDAVRVPLLAITAADVVTGRAAAAARQIAAAAPTSPFAADLAAGPGGLAIPAAMLEIATSIALPALLRQRRAEPPPPAPPAP